MERLTFMEKSRVFFGYGYLVNHRSKEIHRLNNRHKNCHSELISDKNREFVTRRKAMKLIAESGYNGCRWCWKEQNKG